MSADPTAALKDLHNALVPASYAEKAMASLLQLHGEVLEEKERRVDLYRRLMEREQSVAELRMYVQLLEERLARAENTPPPRIEKPAVLNPEPPRVPSVMSFARRAQESSLRSPLSSAAEPGAASPSTSTSPPTSPVAASAPQAPPRADAPAAVPSVQPRSTAFAPSRDAASRDANAPAAPTARHSREGWKTW